MHTRGVIHDRAPIATDAGPPQGGRPPGMAWVPSGCFQMGSDDFYPEERPVREVDNPPLFMESATQSA
jgi:formylglycine-generating enzyme required for sulfatase activity